MNSWGKNSTYHQASPLHMVDNSNGRRVRSTSIISNCEVMQIDNKIMNNRYMTKDKSDNNNLSQESRYRKT